MWNESLKSFGTLIPSSKFQSWTVVSVHVAAGGQPAVFALAMLHVGARVTINGLKSRADLNGAQGSVVSKVVASGRWQVGCARDPRGT